MFEERDIAAEEERPEITYERPTICDFGDLVELTAGSKSSSAADQIFAQVPAAFS